MGEAMEVTGLVIGTMIPTEDDARSIDEEGAVETMMEMVVIQERQLQKVVRIQGEGEGLSGNL